jgi:Zn finger protein HypA/HybF involved in hydrogenase expression
MTFQQEKRARGGGRLGYRKRDPQPLPDLANTHYRAKWRREHPETAKEAARRQVLRRTDRAKALIRTYLEGPCADCGMMEPEIMEFDHVPERGPKLYGIREYRAGWKALQVEIEKCDVVCPNCHARRTNIRRVQP